MLKPPVWGGDTIRKNDPTVAPYIKADTDSKVTDGRLHHFRTGKQ